MKHVYAECSTSIVLGVTPQGDIHLVVNIVESESGESEPFERWEFEPHEVQRVIKDLKTSIQESEHPSLKEAYQAAIKALKSPDIMDMMTGFASQFKDKGRYQ